LNQRFKIQTSGDICSEVRTLVNEEKAPGKYSVTFDGTGLSSGVYFSVLKAGDFISTKKMIFVK
jgi:hypothetical protein